MNGFGYEMRRQRRLKGLTQEDLACDLGVTASFVSKVERGSARPSQWVIDRCVEILGVQYVAEPNAPYSKAKTEARMTQAATQLSLDFNYESSWVSNLLPEETLLENGDPPVYFWDIPQTIPQLSYLTHNFYRYYGKFPPTIARKLIHDYRPSSGHWVLDSSPFKVFCFVLVDAQ